MHPVKRRTLLLVLTLALAVSAPARVIERPDAVVVYSADLPLRAIRRMGPIRVEVGPEGVGAINDSARGWIPEGAGRIQVVWQRPPLRASLRPRDLASAITRLASEDERATGLAPVMVDLSDIHHDSIGGYPVELYRIRFSPTAHVNVWTTDALPRSETFVDLIAEAAGAVSRDTGPLVSQIPGLPLHVELVSRKTGRVDLLRLSTVEASGSISRRHGFALPVPLARLLLRMVG